MLENDGHYDGIEVEMQDTAGNRFWVISSAQPLIFEGEKCFLNSIIVIDDRKQAEKEITRQSAILTAVLDNLDQGVTMADENLNLLACNDRFLRFSGFLQIASGLVAT